MTIAELIQQLAQFDPDLPVMVKGYEGGYNDISIIEQIDIQLNMNHEDYYGAHGDVRDRPDPNKPMTTVLYLAGLNHNCDRPQSSIH